MGWVMEKLHMPPLLGMLLTGTFHQLISPLLLVQVSRSRISPTLTWHGGLTQNGTLQHAPLPWYSETKILRGLKYFKVVILLRACLGLSPEALKKLSAMVFRLAFMPCLAESFAGKEAPTVSFLSSGCGSSSAPGPPLAVGIHARLCSRRCQPCCRRLLPSQPSGEGIRCHQRHPNSGYCCR